MEHNINNKKNIIIGSLVALFVVVIIAGASYFAYNSLNKPNVGELMSNSIDYYISNEIESSESVINLNLELLNINDPDAYDPEFHNSLLRIDNLKINLAYNVKSEKDANNEDVIQGDIVLLLNSDSKDGLVLNNQKASLTFMLYPDSFYFKLNELPPILDLVNMPELENLKRIVGNWYESPVEVIDQMAGLPVNSIANLSETLGYKEIAEIKNFLNTGEIFDVKKVKTLNHEQLGIVKDVRTSINWDELINASIEISSSYGVPISQTELDSLNNSIDTIKQSPVKDLSLSFYVKDDIIKGLGTSGELKNQETDILYIKYNVDASITNINEKFNLQRPTNTKNFMELLNTLLFVLI